MVATEYMKVKNNLIVDTKFGRRRVINLKNKDGGDEAIWIEQLDAMAHIKPNTTVECIRGVKGGLTILERSAPSPQDPPRNVNGKGLKPINEVLGGNTIPTQAYSRPSPALASQRQAAQGEQLNGNSHSTAVNHQEVVEDTFNDLGLPEPLTDAQKKAIHKLCIERARLLVHSIEVVRKELDNKGIEFHEGSIRSLGVSLFIHISKNLP